MTTTTSLIGSSMSASLMVRTGVVVLACRLLAQTLVPTSLVLVRAPRVSTSLTRTPQRSSRRITQALEQLWLRDSTTEGP